MPEQRRSRSTEAFFGRRHGKTIRPVQARALGGYDEFALDLGTPCPANPAGLFATGAAWIRLEIGFGGGEHLHHEAGRFPETGFIAVEPFVNGLAKFLVLQAQERRPNIRLYNDDATRLLDWLPAASLDGIDLLYPDPWPKKRHWKRRFVNAANLDRFARVLKSGGRFRFASDMASYVNWTLQRVVAHPAFAWDARSADDWRVPYEGWPGTRYEAKAIREGRTPAYLTFRRI